MPTKETQIVIKKITVVSGGAHGGAWKVAFADFMTAMMCFFLVMWLTSQSEETKKNVSDYFSTPSVIEYSFSNFGVQLTLEKLFLDLINEPLKFFQNFMSPMDSTPNIFDFGSQKIVTAHLADQLGDLAQNVQVGGDVVEFEIPDQYLFLPGTDSPAAQNAEIMDKVKGIFGGLEDSVIEITSIMSYHPGMTVKPGDLQPINSHRLEIIKTDIEKRLEHDTVELEPKAELIKVDRMPPPQGPTGSFRFKVKQKEYRGDGKKTKKLDVAFGNPDREGNVYDSFVKQIVERKAKKAADSKSRSGK